MMSDFPDPEALPDSEEGWMTVLSPNQFAVLRQAATEPPGFSEMNEGELEAALKKEHSTSTRRRAPTSAWAAARPVLRALQIQLRMRLAGIL